MFPGPPKTAYLVKDMSGIQEPTATQHKHPPITKDHWLFRSTLRVARHPLNFMQDKHKIHGRIFRIDTNVRPIIVLIDPAMAEHVLQKNHRNYVKSYDYDVLKTVLGEGLLTSDGGHWLRQRRLAQPAFHKKRLESLSRYMSEETEDMLERWHQLKAKKKGIDITQEMMNVTMKIAARSLFGSDVSGRASNVSQSVTAANEWVTTKIRNPFYPPTWVPIKLNNRLKKALKELDSAVYGMIEDRRKSGEQRDDLLGMLMEAKDEDTGETMTDEQLRDEVITLFIAGHETTANGLAWLYYLLAQKPEVVRKLKAEAKEVLQGRNATFEDLPRLTYTDKVIKEGLRMYPPAWVVGRKALEADTIAGYHVPKDCNVIIFNYQIHRLDAYWEDPQEFRPERFTETKLKEIPRFAYFPFGGGPRLCIGNNFALMEMKVLIANIAQHFSLKLKNPDLKPLPEPMVTLRPSCAIEMEFEEDLG